MPLRGGAGQARVWWGGAGWGGRYTFAYSRARRSKSSKSTCLDFFSRSKSDSYRGAFSLNASSPYICFQLMVPFVQLAA